MQVHRKTIKLFKSVEAEHLLSCHSWPAPCFSFGCYGTATSKKYDVSYRKFPQHCTISVWPHNLPTRRLAPRVFQFLRIYLLQVISVFIPCCTHEFCKLDIPSSTAPGMTFTDGSCVDIVPGHLVDEQRVSAAAFALRINQHIQKVYTFDDGVNRWMVSSTE